MQTISSQTRTGRWCPSSEMTIYNAMDNKSRLMELMAQSDQLEIDLSKIRQIDSSGLQLLIMAKLEAEANQKTISLTGHSDSVVEVIDLCNLSGFFGDPVVMSSRDVGEKKP